MMTQHYREMAKAMMSKYGRLQRVEYLSHYPSFEIDFVYEGGTVRSGHRTGNYDINFLSLGYIGEGPRYARAFLDESGFQMSAEDIKAIKPGAVIELKDGKVVVGYPKGVYKGVCWYCGEVMAEKESGIIAYPPQEHGRGYLAHYKCDQMARDIKKKSKDGESHGLLDLIARRLRK